MDPFELIMSITGRGPGMHYRPFLSQHQVHQGQPVNEDQGRTGGAASSYIVNMLKH